MVGLGITEGESGLSVADGNHRNGLNQDKEAKLGVCQELQEHHSQLSHMVLCQESLSSAGYMAHQLRELTVLPEHPHRS